MEIDIQVLKKLPVEQIKKFEDRTIYNTAVFTREYTKSSTAYPELSGELKRQEIAAPIENLGNNTYGLTGGVGYAKYVWNYKNAKWTNPNTQPQWYASVLKSSTATIISNAVQTTLKEV
jgi:hypothetical protein